MATIDKILSNHFLKSINELLEKFKATTIISKLELKKHHSKFLWLINYYNNIKFIVIHLKIDHNEK
ncbi:hypothetical protein [Spiroplasma eriocheiris]|uniref:Uncharacterized protein n=1 Tax=Spiroplasma eriocheiris TaxID=315358 RepID=A0A0H3XI97_9MOLU|nr:hypothetical protein [Spiroplasma eriocheiris]AHF57739.1 hypothetical protein SPE_0611 [Spiroplasma eriocheiris CCTCC M 207170]AKM54190.1 hypothetical protein SERIO_v1c06190 [Spiroplasma eriocheiris]